MENDIEGTYPIIIDGVQTGKMTVTREGLFWNFDAKSGMREEIIRLYVYGDGNEGYLGVMEPFGDTLKLTKKFSRSALSTFPHTITHAGTKNESMLPETQVEAQATTVPDSPPDVVSAVESSSRMPLPYEYDDFGTRNVPQENEKPPPQSSNFFSPESGSIWRPCAIPCSLFTGIKEKQLCSYMSGCLISNYEDATLLAVPESSAIKIPDNNVIHFLSSSILLGKNYLICKIEHGKSISEH